MSGSDIGGSSLCSGGRICSLGRGTSGGAACWRGQRTGGNCADAGNFAADGLYNRD